MTSERLAAMARYKYLPVCFCSRFSFSAKVMGSGLGIPWLEADAELLLPAAAGAKAPTESGRGKGLKREAQAAAEPRELGRIGSFVAYGGWTLRCEAMNCRTCLTSTSKTFLQMAAMPIGPR